MSLWRIFIPARVIRIYRGEAHPAGEDNSAVSALGPHLYKCDRKGKQWGFQRDVSGG